MQAWVEGDARAFDRLHATHADRLWRFVRRSIGDEDLARELYQDIWMRVIDQRNRWRPEGRFVGWLYAIAWHRLIDFHRAERRRPITDDAADPDRQVVAVERPLTPEECAAMQQDEERVRRALDALPGPQREAVLLHHVAGLTLSEVAQVCALPRETIKSRLRYGANRLRRRLRSLSQQACADTNPDASTDTDTTTGAARRESSP